MRPIDTDAIRTETETPEALDSDRIVTLVESSKTTPVIALLSTDAATPDEDYRRITEI
ncbi:MAG TPA: hypothetical protein VFJ06_05890 [Halococcus sp.]|nr:hypothetical protein [Halococcus sp.]